MQRRVSDALADFLLLPRGPQCFHCDSSIALTDIDHDNATVQLFCIEMLEVHISQRRCDLTLSFAISPSSEGPTALSEFLEQDFVQNCDWAENAWFWEMMKANALSSSACLATFTKQLINSDDLEDTNMKKKGVVVGSRGSFSGWTTDPEVYVHCRGSPRIWIIVAREQDARLRSVISRSLFGGDAVSDDLLSRTMCSTEVLRSNGIEFERCVQKEGESCFFFGTHFGFDCGFNVMERFEILAETPSGSERKEGSITVLGLEGKSNRTGDCENDGDDDGELLRTKGERSGRRTDNERLEGREKNVEELRGQWRTGKRSTGYREQEQERERDDDDGAESIAIDSSSQALLRTHSPSPTQRHSRRRRLSLLDQHAQSSSSFLPSSSTNQANAAQPHSRRSTRLENLGVIHYRHSSEETDADEPANRLLSDGEEKAFSKGESSSNARPGLKYEMRVASSLRSAVAAAAAAFIATSDKAEAERIGHKPRVASASASASKKETADKKAKSKEATKRGQKKSVVRWTLEEENELLQGVAENGRQWTKILQNYSFHPSRTAVDLKDKHRNILSRFHAEDTRSKGLGNKLNKTGLDRVAKHSQDVPPQECDDGIARLCSNSPQRVSTHPSDDKFAIESEVSNSATAPAEAAVERVEAIKSQSGKRASEPDATLATGVKKIADIIHSTTTQDSVEGIGHSQPTSQKADELAISTATATAFQRVLPLKPKPIAPPDFSETASRNILGIRNIGCIEEPTLAVSAFQLKNLISGTVLSPIRATSNAISTETRSSSFDPVYRSAIPAPRLPSSSRSSFPPPLIAAVHEAPNISQSALHQQQRGQAERQFLLHLHRQQHRQEMPLPTLAEQYQQVAHFQQQQQQGQVFWKHQPQLHPQYHHQSTMSSMSTGGSNEAFFPIMSPSVHLGTSNLSAPTTNNNAGWPSSQAQNPADYSLCNINNQNR